MVRMTPAQLARFAMRVRLRREQAHVALALKWGRAHGTYLRKIVVLAIQFKSMDDNADHLAALEEYKRRKALGD